jgi:hypothetical protein
MQLKESTPFPDDSAATIYWHTHNPPVKYFVVLCNCFLLFGSLFSLFQLIFLSPLSSARSLPDAVNSHILSVPFESGPCLDAIYSRVSEELGAIITLHSITPPGQSIYLFIS